MNWPFFGLVCRGHSCYEGLSDYYINFSDRGVLHRNCRQLSPLVSELCSGRLSSLREPTNKFNSTHKMITEPNFTIFELFSVIPAL